MLLNIYNGYVINGGPFKLKILKAINDVIWDYYSKSNNNKEADIVVQSDVLC